MTESHSLFNMVFCIKEQFKRSIEGHKGFNLILFNGTKRNTT